MPEPPPWRPGSVECLWSSTLSWSRRAALTSAPQTWSRRTATSCFRAQPSSLPTGDEAARLTGLDAETPAVELARAVHALGPAVVLTGGDPSARRCEDVVVDAAGTVTVLGHPGVSTRNDHGTGCTFSAALAVHLGHGDDLVTASWKAQRVVVAALRTASTWQLGRGRGPLAHIACPPTKEH